ncbi:GDSL esterase/lipase At5g03610 [Linum perenne]
MEKYRRFLLFFCTILMVWIQIGHSTKIGEGVDHHKTVLSSDRRAKRDTREHHRHNGHLKLFVFGDSYLDTGNFQPNNGSWLPPYGVTFPGIPDGRFSDGRVLTDYIADFLGIRSPVPYKQIRTGKSNTEQLKWGVNFAHGGTGILNTMTDGPILENQITQLRQLIRHRFYNQTDIINNSVAIVAASGNDYKSATLETATALTTKLIQQLKIDVRRIHEELGIPKVGILLMQPAGCLPQSVGPSAMYSFECNEPYNAITRNHNELLREAVNELIKETKNNKTSGNKFVILDLFQAFSVALEEHKYHVGSLNYKNPLKPCLSLEHGEYACNSDGSRYRVCKHPELSFFFDCNHPSQNGWYSIFLALRHSLYQLYDP